MRFVMAGRTFALEDLEPTMDKAFLDLHAAFLNGAQFNMSDFEKIADGFFGASIHNPSAHDSFFNNFKLIWRWLMDGERMDEAESLWEMALQPALLWESRHPGKYIHKGTPFYLWAVSAIMKGDLDRGYTLMHQALEEDARTYGSQFPDTPAFAFATLNYTKVDPTFRQWPLTQAEFLGEFVTEYRSTYGSQLTPEDFRRRFLSNPPRMDAVFLFSYALGRLFRMDKMPDYALDSAFAGQLEINLLFDITLVIDAAIKGRNPSQWQFIDHAAFLSRAIGLGLTKKQFQYIGTHFRDNFDSALTALLDGTFTLSDGMDLPTAANDLAIAYGLRNHGAHDVSSVLTVRRRFRHIRQSLFNSLFLSVEVLY